LDAKEGYVIEMAYLCAAKEQKTTRELEKEKEKLLLIRKKQLSNK
jgi:hypothetical protein